MEKRSKYGIHSIILNLEVVVHPQYARFIGLDEA